MATDARPIPGVLAQVAAVDISFGFSPTATRFWWLDQVSRWSPTHTSPEHRQAVEQFAALSAVEQSALEGYARVRSAHAHAHAGPRPLNAAGAPTVPTLDALPPALGGHGEFAHAFMTEETVDAALTRLKLPAADAQTVRNAFLRLGPRIDKHHLAEALLEVAAARLTERAAQGDLARFGGQIAHFFGVTPTEPVRVVLVPAPDGKLRATQLGTTIVLPVSTTLTASLAEQADALGIVAHELGHYLLSLSSDTTRQRVTRDIDGRLGLPNLERRNLFDEALQTALGNLLFTKRAFPEHHDATTPAYSDTPTLDYPYAIDAYARSLLPHLERLFAIRGGLTGEFLRLAAREHRELFPAALRHHTRVLSLLTDDPATETQFVGLFAASERARFPSAAIPAFFTATERSNAPRWIVGTARWVATERKRLAPVEPLLEQVLGALAESRRACVIARVSAERGALDVVVLGDDLRALRRLLIAIHRGLPVPEARPSCT